MSIRRVLAATAALAFLMTALAGNAAAHASANSADGKVRVTWGFLDEPAYTHQKNRLDLIIRDAATGAGIGGIAPGALTVALRYGEQEYDLGEVTANRGAKGAAFAGPGNYTSGNHVYLTRPGIYALVVKGEINGSAIDLVIPAAHEYEPMGAIMFPDEVALGGGSGDASSLEARLAALEQQVAALRAQQQTQAQTPATLTPQPTDGRDAPAAGILLAVLAAVAVALARRRA